LNCLTGTVLETSASAAGLAVAFRCADGSAAAVLVTPDTQIAAKSPKAVAALNPAVMGVNASGVKG